MMNRHFGTLGVMVAALIISSCSPAGADEEEMLALASNLPGVASAVDAHVAYDGAQPTLEGEALLRAATKHRPKMLAPFDGYYVTARQADGFTSVLVCNVSRSTALLEDTACSTEVDGHYWRQGAERACAFELDLRNVCK